MRVKDSAVLGDFVYEQIKEMILTRKIKCGEKIQEQLIEKELGVSRTPVREAVRRLSNEGIVVLYPNRHAEVISFDKQSIQDLGMVRITMDCLAAQLSIQNGSNRDFDELKVIAEKCEAAHNQNDLFQQISYDSQFHLKLVEISENSILINILNNILLKTQLLQTALIEDTASTVCDIHHHQVMMKALYERNLPDMLNAIQSHLCPFYGIQMQDIHPVQFQL
ncbi:GntR family transcriptional regulator [Clostridium minihomine]|uniref:GntR family transcriptional regulator n=1 Tax=Clostridium minihomine TaxID=2045012 RepID=UPI000C75AD7A|nr:GntR family transcriptional regulator [Clostridium minihomine]